MVYHDEDKIFSFGKYNGYNTLIIPNCDHYRNCKEIEDSSDF